MTQTQSGPHIKLAQGRLRGELFIAGTGLRVSRRDGTYRLSCDSHSYHDWTWLNETGLAGQQFARRCDLLAAVAAHTAINPLPASAPQHDEITLRRRPDGTYITAEGDYIVRRVTGPDLGRFARRWEIIHASTDLRSWPPDEARNLAYARAAIAYARQKAAEDLHARAETLHDQERADQARRGPLRRLRDRLTRTAR